MFGWVKMLFGGTKAAQDTRDFVMESTRGIGNWIDEQQLTAQEKMEATFRWGDMALQQVIATANENGVRSVTRRVMAWSIMGTFLFLILLSAFSFPFNPEYSAFLLQLTHQTYLGELTLAVGIFYFGVHLLRNWRGKAYHAQIPKPTSPQPIREGPNRPMGYDEDS